MEYEVSDPKQRRWTYWVCIVLLIGLTVVAVLMFSTARSTARAEERADEFIAALEAAGAPTPSREQVVRVLGDDGGATCADPGSALGRAVLFSMLTNGAAGPGQRPIIADSRAVQGQLLIIETYCPDELEPFREQIEDLQFEDVIG
ncbi:hypothetical protein EXU48_13705 [Occultella glacieicola]|uniref:DUF732 domain-containing protein n=1 Tax=Occultella glacieicola TaxID=2518684 RepID=A0ABY2E7H3_9MICO|nr:hypothetical protein EXU48_13705 [Occultella glacieicola]